MNDDLAPLFTHAVALREQSRAMIAAAQQVTSTADQICHDATDIRDRTTQERHARHQQYQAPQHRD